MTKTTTTFVERVLSFIKTDDESAVRKTQEQALKVWKKEVSNAEKAIGTLKTNLKADVEDKNEYIAEAKEDLANSYLNIDVDEVKTVSDRKSYVEYQYQQQIANAKQKVENLENQLSDIKDKAEAKIDAKEKMIAMYNENIKAIS